MDFPHHATLFALGAVTGVLASLIGVGGGLVIVPVLTQAYHFRPELAVGTSLCCVFLNSVSGSIEYLRQKRVDVSLGVVLAAWTLPGALVGIWSVQRVESATFDVLFGALMVVAAGLLFAKRRPIAGADTSAAPVPLVATGRARTLTDASGQAFAYRVNLPIGSAVSALVGVLAGFFGVGGGLVHVPFLHRAFGMAIHIAVATSLFTLMFTSLACSAAGIALGQVAYGFLPGLGIGIVFGAQLGARLAPKTKPRVLVALVALALAGMGARLIVRGAGGAPVGPHCSNVSCGVTITGTAAGGSLAIGIVGRNAIGRTEDIAPVTITTRAGESASQVATRFAAAYNSVSPNSVIVDWDGVTLVFGGAFAGRVFYRSTDPGLPGEKNVTGLIATPDAVAKTVTLSWALPAPPPKHISIHRDNVYLDTIVGTSTSFVDAVYGNPAPRFPFSPQPTHRYIVLCVYDPVGNSPASRFSDIMAVDAPNPNPPR